jgi:hypothetical protein
MSSINPKSNILIFYIINYNYVLSLFFIFNLLLPGTKNVTFFKELKNLFATGTNNNNSCNSLNNSENPKGKSGHISQLLKNNSCIADGSNVYPVQNIFDSGFEKTNSDKPKYGKLTYSLHFHCQFQLTFSIYQYPN